MILYQDSDSICKKYLNDELGIEETRLAVERSDALVVSWLSYVEVRAALAAARRANRFRSQDEYTRAQRNFEEDWGHYFKVEVSQEIVQRAAQLAENHSLKSYDAVHLAVILSLQGIDLIEVSTWDRDLRRAAVNEGFVLAHEVTT